MTPRFLLNTDTSSCIMKRSNAAVLAKLRTVPVAAVSISAITRAELMYGVEMSPRRAQDEAALQAFLRHAATLDFSASAATHYAQIRADLKRSGRLIGANDLLIAAHARALGFVLVTNNVDEFERVEGLEIENWAA